MIRKLLLLLFLLLNITLGYADTCDGFEIIDVKGNFRIELQRGNQHRFDIVSPNEAEQGVMSRVEGGTLYLWRDKKTDKIPLSPTVVKITAPYIREINLSDNAKLTTGNLGASGLIVNVQDSEVHLDGYINIRRIRAGGESVVDIMWVNSDQLQILADGDSEIRVAGVTKLLSARLAGCATLDAKYLRATTVLVQTRDEAKAEVLAIYSLNAFATDQSNIYYYRTPENLAEFNTISGNVLQVAYWR